MKWFAAAASLFAMEQNKVPGTGGFLQGGTFKDPALASALQTTYLIAFWSGVALVIVGVVDAIICRPSESPVIALGPGAMSVRF